MRNLMICIVGISLAACATDDSGSGPAFELVTHDITLMPGQEAMYCYYLHTTNTSMAVINKWVSEKPVGIHHAIMFINPSGSQPPDNTAEATDCGLVGTSMPVWTYSTTDVHRELLLPVDDGAGKPLGQNIAPNTAVYFSLHYINSTDSPLTVHFDLKAFALAPGTPYTETSAYLTYNNSIRIPPGAVNHIETASCNVPAGMNFWLMATHSHKQTTHDEIRDGSSVVFQANDWQHPGAKSWMGAPYYKFTSPQLTWECRYDNTGDNAATTVTSGPSAATNEMCMETGFIFPSSQPVFCVWDTTIPGNCACTN